MGTITRRLAVGGLVGATVTLLSGCSLGSLSYFLGPETPWPAKLKHLSSQEKKVDPKVMILTYARPGEVPVDFIHADRQLSELLAANLMQMAKNNEEKLSILPARRVEEFKNSNPEWRTMDLAGVGKRLGADHVVYLEINNLSLYETGSAHMLFRGRANINVNLVDVNNPDEAPKQEIYACTFPSDNRGPVPVAMDMQPAQFRQMFLTHVARQLSWYFSNYPRADNRMMEPVF